MTPRGVAMVTASKATVACSVHASMSTGCTGMAWWGLEGRSPMAIVVALAIGGEAGRKRRERVDVESDQGQSLLIWIVEISL